MTNVTGEGECSSKTSGKVWTRHLSQEETSQKSESVNFRAAQRLIKPTMPKALTFQYGVIKVCCQIVKVRGVYACPSRRSKRTKCAPLDKSIRLDEWMIKWIPIANKDFHFSHPFKKYILLGIAQINKSNDQITIKLSQHLLLLPPNLFLLQTHSCPLKWGEQGKRGGR